MPRTRDQLPKHTPWGPPQHIDEIAEDIWFFSTSSHGGVHLDRTQQAHVKRLFPKFQTFGDMGPWYEEDCDICAVTVAFADRFSDQDVRLAVDSIDMMANNQEQRRPKSDDGWMNVHDWIWASDDADADRVRKRVMAHRNETASMWRRGGLSSLGVSKAGLSTDYWCVQFYRGREHRERRNVLMPYPDKVFYTQDELDEFDRKAREAAA
jgi:hypothetical protein